jgi:type IV pilus assembly protein PilW
MKRPTQHITRRATAKGFTLIELMISMVLGLVVIGAVVSVLLANKRTYDTTGAMSQVQESARTAFELLARDLRQAGTTGCANNGRVANVLTLASPVIWWQPWFGLTGFDGAATDTAVATSAATGERVSGTDSMQLQTITGNGLSVQSNSTTGATFTFNAGSPALASGDLLMVCDFDHATVFRATAYSTTNVRVTYASGTGASSNCNTGLGYPSNCSSANMYPFAKNSQVAHLTAVDWYIGNNNRPEDGGRSLYRKRITNITSGVQTEEVVAGITDLQIQYRLDGANTFSDAGSVAAADWPKVNALSITLTTTSADKRVSSDASVNSGRLQRSFTWLVTLRNRVP